MPYLKLEIFIKKTELTNIRIDIYTVYTDHVPVLVSGLFNKHIGSFCPFSDMCRKDKDCEYFFSIDIEVVLKEENTLKILIEQNLQVYLSVFKYSW